MMGLKALVVELGEALPWGAADPRSREGVGVSGVDLTLPMEWRIGDDGELNGSLPRGRLATGFDPQLGRIHIRFERRQP